MSSMVIKNSLEKSCSNNLNVLVVSHGSFIREVYKYFVDELNASILLNRTELDQPTHNTSISKFTFLLDNKLNGNNESNKENNFQKWIHETRCEFLNDCQHLSGKFDTECDI
jgi:broad specificity phosphatase PhoE